MRADDLNRFTWFERVVHWAVAVSFLWLLLSGLAFSYPSLFWMTALLGGGSAARALHPWVGAVGAVALALAFVLWAKEMRLGKADVEWLRSIPYYARRRTDKVPPAGKYNGGQKAFFWLQSALACLLLLTGVPLWLPGAFFPRLLALIRLLHYLAALVAALLVIPHVYLATIAHPGTARGMLSGTVSRRWAKLHHPLWSREADR